MLPKRTRFTLSDGRRGPVAVAITVWILVAILLAASCGSREASAADPTAHRLAKLEASVKLLRRDLYAAQVELRRLARLTRAFGCVLRVYEDGSAEFRDAEQVGPACREFIAGYVGSGLVAEDRR